MVRVGIIGSGFGLYGLLPAFNSTKGCKVVSICGKNTERLINYCQSIGLKNIYINWQEMLDQEKLDAVAIAVVPSVQYDIAKYSIKKGLHVFAEKPMTITYSQAQELLKLARKKKIKHGLDFIFPDIEEWREVKQLIAENKYGLLKQINVNWDFQSYDIKNKKSSWKTDSARGGGALSFYFSHTLYYLEYFAGEIINLQSLLTYSKESINGAEVGVDLLIKFKSGVSGYAHVCCNAPGINRHQVNFICQRGTIVLSNENSHVSNFSINIHTDKGIEQLSLPREKDLEGEDERVTVVKKLTTRFIKAINYNKKMLPSFQDGVRVQELIAKIKSQDNPTNA